MSRDRRPARYRIVMPDGPITQRETMDGIRTVAARLMLPTTETPSDTAPPFAAVWERVTGPERDEWVHRLLLVAGDGLIVEVPGSGTTLPLWSRR